MTEEETQAVRRADSREDRRVVGDCNDAADRERNKPNEGEGAKPCRDLSGAVRLHRKEEDENHQRQRKHHGLESGGNKRQPLDGG